ncbi:MAG: histidinol-phosphatase [Muribaculaceae bacterium]|nr:histidinol-phosphatase [Muribaculaceae bacterium]
MINFSAIAQASSQYNFHTHTQFCDGHAPMEAFVREAINLGFAHLGFTPHGPVHVESPCNMSRGSVAAFLDEVQRLRATYEQRITLYAGMEVDYIDGQEQSDPELRSLSLDYRIGSVHFIPSFSNPEQYVDIDGRFERFKEKMAVHFHGDIEAVVRSFFAQSMQMVDTGGFDVVGHFDKIGFNASMYAPGIDKQPWYSALVLELFEAIMDHHYVIEINTKAWEQHGRFFPHSRYFALLKKYQAPVIINSDAHYPALLNSGRPEALRLLQQA